MVDELTVQAVFVIPGYNRSSMEAMLVCVHVWSGTSWRNPHLSWEGHKLLKIIIIITEIFPWATLSTECIHMQVMSKVSHFTYWCQMKWGDGVSNQKEIPQQLWID